MLSLPLSIPTHRALVPLIIVSTLIAGACGASAKAEAGPYKLRLGYLSNLTHAPALIGVDNGFFARALGSKATLSTQTFNAGPAESEAILGGGLDAAFVGPSPAVNLFSKSHGEAIRVVAGTTSGGAGGLPPAKRSRPKCVVRALKAWPLSVRSAIRVLMPGWSNGLRSTLSTS